MEEMEDNKEKYQYRRKGNKIINIIHEDGNKNKVYCLIGLCFGLLCLLQVTANIVLRLHYGQSEEKEQLLINLTELVEERDELLKTIDDMDTRLRKELDEDCHNGNTSITDETDELNSSRTEDRDQLLTNYSCPLDEAKREITNSSLIDQIDLYQTTSWNFTEKAEQLLVSVTEEKQQMVTGYNNLVDEIKQLLTIYQNLTAETQQLWTSYYSLDEGRKKVTTSYNNMVKERFRFHEKLKDAGWKSFQSSLYFFSSRRGSWYRAREDCRQRGADLVIISSPEEQDYLSKQRHICWSWIGLTDREREGVWKWVDGTPLTVGYWNQSQPDDWRGGEDCVHLYYPKYRGRWNDNSCDRGLCWICEMKV